MNALKFFSGILSKKSYLIITLAILCGFSGFAQPLNDDACAPIPLTPTASCTYQTFTNVAATASPGVPAPGCALYVSGDVWFTVTVPAGGALTFDTQTGGITDGGMAIYSGDCNNLVLIECDDDDSPNGNMPLITRTGLVPGSTIWVRFWTYNGGAGGTFGICVTIPPPPPPPPVNDDPCAPIALTVGSTCNYQTFTNAAATASPGVPAPGCASYSGGDVWFTVVVPAGGSLIFDTQTGFMTDGGMAIYSGNCNNLVLIECDDDDSPNGAMPMITRSGLTPGSTIWIRMWEYGNNGNGTFGICVTTPPPPPANDNCTSAVSLTVNPTAVCTVTATGTTVGGTTSTAPAPTCSATGVNDDVWYSFVATGPIHSVSLTNVTGTSTDMAMALYGGNCAAPVYLNCADPNTMVVNGLTAGQTYFVRVWTATATAGLSANFTICVSVPPPPPANDEPCNAITLTVAENGTCNYQAFTNGSATATTGAPAPGCASYSGGDVWFKVVVPCSGSIILDSQTGVVTDGGMAIYSGTCTGLTLIQCDDDGSANGLMPRISRTGLVPGSTLWIRFWEFGNDNNGTFSICAQVPPPPPPAATCATAQSFCTSTTPTTVPNITGQPNTAGGGVYGCLATIPNPTYYYLQIQNSGNISITISQASTTGLPLDVDFIVWGPFTSLSAACSGISTTNDVDCSYSTAAVEVADIPNAVAGQYYLFLVTNFSDQAGAITYQQTGGTGSSNCGIVCNLAAVNSGPVCPGSSLNLTSSTVPNATYLWSGPNCFSSTQQNPTGVTAPQAPGQYVYTVVATGASGTICTDTTIVTVSPRPSIGADSTIKICSGTTRNLTTLYTTTGLTSSWTLGGVAVPNPAAVSVGGLYRLVVANTQGCTDTAFVTLVVSTVDGTVTSTNANCTTNGNITIANPSGISPYSYSISTSPTVFQAGTTFSATNGSYTIIIKDSLGCTISKPVTVGLTNNLSITGRADTTICNGGSAVLTTTGNATSYTWSPTTGLSNPNIASPVASPTTSTAYTVRATLGQCTATDVVNVTVEQAIQLYAGADVVLVSGEKAQLNASASGGTISSILWTPATGLNATNILNPEANPTVTTLYTLTVRNTRGCSASDDLLVTVVPYCIKVKNAFTPNGDGLNDLWQIYDDYACLKNVSLHVFNRYGNKVFESRDYRNNWDGTYGGKPVPDATYYAVINFTLITGKVVTMKTDLTILR
jgi:gliding motility-associated-like protein